MVQHLLVLLGSPNNMPDVRFALIETAVRSLDASVPHARLRRSR